ADNLTDSMSRAIGETNRRRAIQQKYNDENGITPQTVRAAIRELMEIARTPDKGAPAGMDELERLMAIDKLEEQMLAAAGNLDFEKAAKLRDQMLQLRGEKPMGTNESSRPARRRRKS
ncbi:MAG: excinuclease ABC subunit B, partial [Clostridiales bacterium]|nr:excinuclease ABC subunit B [Clostridiales bacterium]